jgi:uncharacterized protein (DUF4415 family)
MPTADKPASRSRASAAKLDAEMLAFEQALLRSVDQALAGEHAAVHTPDAMAERKRGRPVGSKQNVTKEATKIRLDPDILAALRHSGAGWQTRVNDMLRASLRLTGQA